MSDRVFEHAVRDWLEAGSDRTPPAAVDAVLLAVKTTPQERDLRIPRRFSPMTTSMRLAAGIAIVAILGAGTLLLLNQGFGVGGRPTPIPVQTASPAPRGTLGAPGSLVVVAKDIAFDVQALEVAADQPFTIRLRNDDPTTMPHDIDIRSADGSQTLEDQPTTDGGASQVYRYDALQAGTYEFICSIHPIPLMTGTLTVK